MDRKSLLDHIQEEERLCAPALSVPRLGPAPGDGQRAQGFAITVADWDGQPLTAQVKIEQAFRLGSVRIVGPGRLCKVLVLPQGPEGAEVHEVYASGRFDGRTWPAECTYQFQVERTKGWGNRRLARVVVEVSGYVPIAPAAPAVVEA